MIILKRKFIDFSHKNNYLATITLAYLFVYVSAYAQTPLPVIARVDDVFLNRPDRIEVGGDVVFKIKNQQAEKIVNSGLQIRVFALRDSEDRPAPISNIEDCDIFLSTIINLKYPGNQEVIAPAFSYAWLNLTNSLNTIIPGRYFFVFEKSGPGSNQFRLKHTDYKEYFDSGFLLTIDRDAKVNIDLVKNAYFERLQLLAQARLQIDHNVNPSPCYTYRHITAEASSDNLIAENQLQYCTTKDEPTM